MIFSDFAATSVVESFCCLFVFTHTADLLSSIGPTIKYTAYAGIIEQTGTEISAKSGRESA